MTYYAVTNDPNELMHFGIKGMKWGVIRTPEQLGHHEPPKKARTKTAKPKENKPRSPAYQKASAKLGRAMRAGIAKAQANWKEYNSPANKAARAYIRDMKRDERAYKRNEKAFQKHLQLAREGRLKYKGISDEEVGRITDRLALERSSRLLSGTEKQSFGRRLRERVGEGVIEGAGRGVSGYVANRIEARGRATAEIKAERRKIRAQYTPSGWIHRKLDTHLDNAESKQQAKRESARENYKYEHNQQRLDADKKADREARETAEENYLSLIEENRMLGFDPRHSYSTDRGHVSRLTTAELKGRTKALESAHKVYDKENEATVKALYGGKDIKRKNPETGEEETVTEYAGRTIDELGDRLPTRTPRRSSSSDTTRHRPIVTPHPGTSGSDSGGPDPSSLRSSHTRSYMDSAHSVHSLHGVRRTGINDLSARTDAVLNAERERADRIAERERIARLAVRERQLEAADRVREKRERNTEAERRRKAQNEGYSYYAERAATRERDEAERRASIARDAALLRLEDGSSGANIGNPVRQNWRVTRTQTRRRNYR